MPKTPCFRPQTRIAAAWERLGRCGELAELESKQYWRDQIDSLEAYSAELERRDVHDHNDLFTAAVDLVQRHRPDPGWAAVLVDEVQDLPLVARWTLIFWGATEGGCRGKYRSLLHTDRGRALAKVRRVSETVTAHRYR